MKLIYLFIIVFFKNIGMIQWRPIFISNNIQQISIDKFKIMNKKVEQYESNQTNC